MVRRNRNCTEISVCSRIWMPHLIAILAMSLLFVKAGCVQFNVNPSGSGLIISSAEALASVYTHMYGETNPAACAARCGPDAACNSFAYGTATGVCVIQSNTFANAAATSAQVGFEWYDKA